MAKAEILSVAKAAFSLSLKTQVSASNLKSGDGIVLVRVIVDADADVIIGTLTGVVPIDI